MSQNSLNIVSQNSKNTVVTEFTPTKQSSSYQSESDLEREFIKILQSQAYEYITIKSEDELKSNLRTNLEKLNDYKFSDSEWSRFFNSQIANQTSSIEDKTLTIQKDYKKVLKRDDGSDKNIYLIYKMDEIGKYNIHKNHLQVINQYSVYDGSRTNRYDVTILVNGLPLVHIELKRRGIAIREAFNQINRYSRESFWAGSGLFEYVQIFVISNGTHTKYYSNTTRFSHIKEQNNRSMKNEKKSSNSFEFTSWWATADNKPIADLIDFTKTFFAKHTILNILTKYCIFTREEQLLVMRPYQIVATERIINQIKSSHNYKKYGKIEAGGYIWHTTGSGKTLTSFKSAQLASELSYIKKVLFVVDRKDLDYQTMKEYDKFEKGAANSNSSTNILQKQLKDPNAKIIITTIQKLDRFIKKYRDMSILDDEVVIIFDECHRSQFGDMHKSIKKAFKKYYLFGFTGTPIFNENSSGSNITLKTTEQAFGRQLHTYTIIDAINDKNVLPFKVDYISTMREKEDIDDEKINGIDRERALRDPKRIQNITSYILEHFDQKTKRNSTYKLKDKRVKGFNSIFAVSSIPMAKLYYAEFKKQLSNKPSDEKLKVATIFSYVPNEEELDNLTDENPEDTSNLDQSSRDFLESVIIDYNQMFQTSYDTSSDKFQNYYKDISSRVKNKEIDILIVVNMFLTGFDATTLNTLWIDKNLKHHGLIQAFSRTNRILNSIKTFGNIVCFRNLDQRVNAALSLFGNTNSSGIVLIKTFDEYYNGYKQDGKTIKGYRELIDELLDKYPLGDRIEGEENQREFIKLYGNILKLENILKSFDEFDQKRKELEDLDILTPRDIQDYHSVYIDMYNNFRVSRERERESINDDLVFEMELIKQVEVNIDYIIELIKKYHSQNTKDQEILQDINKAIASSVELRNKKDLINQFITSLNDSSNIDKDWREHVEKSKTKDLEKIIKDENLNHDETFDFIQKSFKEGLILERGTTITNILPPMSIFDKEQSREKKKQTVIDKLKEFFDRFFDISSGVGE